LFFEQAIRQVLATFKRRYRISESRYRLTSHDRTSGPLWDLARDWRFPAAQKEDGTINVQEHKTVAEFLAF
jgi:hypothetical protein